MRYLRWPLLIVAGVFVALLVAARITSRAPIVKRRLINALDQQLDADVQLQSLDVRFFPALRIHGDGLTLRLKHQQQAAPFVQVDHFEVEGGIFGMLRRRHRFSYVELRGLRITIPPRTGNDRESGAKAASTIAGPILIDHLVSDEAQLVFVPNDPQKQTKVFSIHHLELESVGFNREIPFRATLTNAMPKGEIDSSGTFGPWVAYDPGSTAIAGSYTFDHADLSTIKGISGDLTSKGGFTGQLAQLDVRGTSTTPDFQLKGVGQPVSLETRFHVLVDGTNGNTYLKHVDARIVDTNFTATGTIVASPGVKGRTAEIEADMPLGRLQDVLKLAVDAPRPLMLGAIVLKTKIVLAPGDSDVADRLQLDGEFALDGVRFTDQAVQAKVVMLSRRSRGEALSDDPGRVLTGMHGRLALKNGVVRFDRLAFSVPGADITLSGGYALRSEQLHLAGNIAMQATISKAAGGWKGLLLKPFDPLFRHHGGGAVLPIRIEGTRKNPHFAVNWKQALGGW